jgi:YjbE family integral membrane protein
MLNLAAQDYVAIAQIIWIDLLLSGDNAVVIALACRQLPERQRRIGIFLGAATAILLRIFFAYIITQILGIPFLKAAGGLLLLWIAVKLLHGEEDEKEANIKPADHLLAAIMTIAIADAVMSLDNVVAIAAIAKENYYLFIFGLALSIPLIVVGASIISSLIDRFPIFIWIGAGILGWVAGNIIASDDAALAVLGITHGAAWHTTASVLATLFVLAAGYIWQQRSKRSGSV